MTIDRRSLVLAGLASLALPALARAQALPTVEEVHFDRDNPVLGNPDGDVSIVEFFDYQCPYCKRDFPDVLRAVADDRNVRLVMKDWPIFGDASAYAARLVLAAPGADYQAALMALMATPARLRTADIDAALSAAGLDPRALEAAYRADAARIDGLLGRTMAMGDAFGFAGTPTFIIGTHLYQGVMDHAALREAIAKARG